MRSVVLSLIVLAGAVGCAANESEEHASQSDALQGTTLSTPRSILSLQVNGGAVRTSVLIADDIVVTSARWVPANTAPNTITIRMPHPSGNDFVTTGTHVNVNPVLGFTAIRLAQPVSLPSGAVPLRNFVSTAPPPGLETTCYGYANGDPRTQKWVWRVTQSQTGDVVTMVPSANGGEGIVYDGDAGMPCVDAKTGYIVGLASGAALKVNASSSFGMVTAAALAPWIAAMRNLGIARNGVLATGHDAVAFYRTKSSTSYCINVDGVTTSPMNQRLCNGGQSQRFWLRALNGGQVAIVSDLSGLCVDVVGAGTTSGTPIQQLACHYGANQAFDMIYVSNAYFLDPLHTPHCVPSPATPCGNGFGLGIAADDLSGNPAMGEGAPLRLAPWSLSVPASSNVRWVLDPRP